MRKFVDKSHVAYEINRKIVVFRITDKKVKFWFKGKGISFLNLRFDIRPHHEFRYFHWLIRLPFFYCEKHNSAFLIGLPNFYARFSTEYGRYL